MAQAAAHDFRPSPAAAGARAYAATAQAALSPVQASLLLHEQLWQELVRAKSAYEAGRLDQMCRRTGKCMRVLLQLQAGLKLRPGAVDTLILSGLYLHLFERIRTAQRGPDVGAAFDEAILMLQRFCGVMRERARAELRAATSGGAAMA
jgi:flagellin-specific chaperone FliS